MQERVRLESEAIQAVLRRVRVGEIRLVVSSTLLAENRRDPLPKRRRHSRSLLRMATVHVDFDDVDVQRAKQLHAIGFGQADAFHVVAAEKAGCDVLLTTDDKLIRKATQHKPLRVRVLNPVDWAMEM
jgi:predicted nucleic acid-binding protein